LRLDCRERMDGAVPERGVEAARGHTLVETDRFVAMRGDEGRNAIGRRSSVGRRGAVRVGMEGIEARVTGGNNVEKLTRQAMGRQAVAPAERDAPRFGR